MGYEITFKYKEATKEVGIYSEDIKERKCKIGQVLEDVGLETLARKIMSQLARRNILIVDVEIFEYAKKKISYRESSDGIVIKNKKFSFDSEVVTIENLENEEKEEDFKDLPSPSLDLADKSCPIVQRTKNLKKPIRYEVYDPDPIGKAKVLQRGFKFTVGKKYPIFSEESISATILYTTTDDSSKEVKVSAEYFIAQGAGLSQADDAPVYVGAENQKEEINLWGRYEQIADVPDIRRK